MIRSALIALFGATLGGSVLAADELTEAARWPDTVRMARDVGVDYPAAVRRARGGDGRALNDLFRVTAHMDGSGAEMHAAVLRMLLQRLGDRQFSQILRGEPRDTRDRVMQQLDFDFGHPWQKQFPLTYSLAKHDMSLLKPNT